MPQILSVNVIPAGPPYTSIILSGGNVSVFFANPASPTPQVGQLVSMIGTVSVPAYTSVSIFRNTFYPLGYIGIDPNLNPQLCIQAGTTAGSAPSYATAIGQETTDGGTIWIRIAGGVSWNFDGLYHITNVYSASNIAYKAASQFLYFNPLGTAGGAGGTTGAGGVHVAVVLTAPEPILEVHNVAASPGGLLYQTTVAFQQGVYTVTLADTSPLLTSIWNIISNPNNLFNPQLFSIWVRLIDTQSFYGVDFNGIYKILSVTSPNSFVILPKSPQFLPNDFGGGGLCEILYTISTADETGFMDVPDTMLETGVPVTDDSVLGVSETSKYASVRKEYFDMGYYADATQVKPPVSSIDGYEYSLAECTFDYDFATSAQLLANAPILGGGEGVITPGALDFPLLAPIPAMTPPITLLVVPYVAFIDEAGNVTCQVYTNYGVQKQGVLHVYCSAYRQATSIVLPAQQLPVP